MNAAEILRAIHGYTFPAEWALLFPTPLALATLLLFIWSFAPAFKGNVGAGFLAWLKLTWVLTFVPMITGMVLAIGGAQVPSSVAAGPVYQQEKCGQVADLTRYCLPVDPVRNSEHWMYTAFTLLTLLGIEALIRSRWNGEFLGLHLGYKLLPLLTLFLYGCVYMIGRVAVLPGNSVGT